ncbi:MAG: hypothetical protein H7A35_06980 [Planctomycetales bacterium]|nr:hypothetical protein [bacterium]UNM09796.1 MAG: hypothetical protein H7A35_06980 [Planctomycetales bacterium]
MYYLDNNNNDNINSWQNHGLDNEDRDGAQFGEDVRYSIDNGQESLESAWKSRMAEIDGYITQFMHEADELSEEMIDDLSHNFSEWWEKQPMSDKVRAEWQKARADGKVVRARMEQRLTHLVEDGKLKWKEWTRRNGAG